MTKHYEIQTEVKVIKLEYGFSLITFDGMAQAVTTKVNAGDYIVINRVGNGTVVSKKDFEDKYKPVQERSGYEFSPLIEKKNPFNQPSWPPNQPLYLSNQVIAGETVCESINKQVT